ncbi:MAG TPA: PIG-L family deacetylase [Armatimonadota bacterium]|nr:PIG-L family deacetylase [Armatimonadota bacterium]
MVFSPHCDDETLGAGGFINAAVRAGADVRVVMMTNGDGFEVAAAWHYKQIRITTALLRKFALARQTETIKADAALGVPRSHITFLGFPDQGLAVLWNSNWSRSKPYFSRFTGCDHNPYEDSSHCGQPYCGAAVLSDVEQCLTRFKPDLVLLPHPNDDHPDHWATSSFVRAAIADLSRRAEASGNGSRTHAADWAREMRCQFYVVHHGDWPVPQGYHPRVRLAPPFSLAHTDTRWSEFPLTAGEEQAKHLAVDQYRSQIAVTGRFLMSFVRRTECYGSIAPARIRVSSSPRPSVMIEESPLSDTFIRAVEPGGNIRAIRAGQKGDDVSFWVEVRGMVSPRVSYTLRLKNAAGPVGSSLYATVRAGRLKTDIPGAAAHAARNEIEVSMPLSQLANRHDWFVAADSRLPYMSIDHAGWREFHVTGS